MIRPRRPYTHTKIKHPWQLPSGGFRTPCILPAAQQHSPRQSMRANTDGLASNSTTATCSVSGSGDVVPDLLDVHVRRRRRGPGPRRRQCRCRPRRRRLIPIRNDHRRGLLNVHERGGVAVAAGGGAAAAGAVGVAAATAAAVEGHGVSVDMDVVAVDVAALPAGRCGCMRGTGRGKREGRGKCRWRGSGGWRPSGFAGAYRVESRLQGRRTKRTNIDWCGVPSLSLISCFFCCFRLVVRVCARSRSRKGPRKNEAGQPCRPGGRVG